MTKRQRAQQVANEIKEVYKADKVIVCWSSGQAQKYNANGLTSNTIGFAYHLTSGDTVIQCVIPIAKKVIFNDVYDNTKSILFTVGAYIQEHIRIMMFTGMVEGLTDANNTH